MSNFDENKKNINEASEESVVDDMATEQSAPEGQDKPLTLEDLEKDISEPSMTYTATLHFEFSDIFNAIEHIDSEPGVDDAAIEPEDEKVTEPEEPESETEVEEEPVEQPEEAETVDLEEPGFESEASDSNVSELAEDANAPVEPETESEPEPDSEEVELEPETEEPTPGKPKSGLIARLRGQDKGTKKLVLTDIILLAVVVISIVAGLAIAHSIVDKANAANEAKIAEMQDNIKEVKLAENLYSMAADKVVDDIAVPTYTLDELYALDLREKTGFTAEDLKLITRKGLVGCEEAFVKAEETYGVNSIFLISIASLESAYGTMMFRPNNMFGYGRTGFSSKEECIMTVAKGLGTRYLPPGGSLYGGSPTLKGVNKRYAANPQWYYKVGKYMQGYYAELAAAKNGALDKFE